MTERDTPRQPPRIPVDHWPQYELVVDVKVMERTSFDSARAYRRIRVPLANVVTAGDGRQVTLAAVGNALGELIEEVIER